MDLEDLSKEELLIREAFIQLSTEISDKYFERNRFSMDAKMHFGLGQLYIKMYKKNHPN